MSQHFPPEGNKEEATNHCLRSPFSEVDPWAIHCLRIYGFSWMSAERAVIGIREALGQKTREGHHARECRQC